MDTSSLDLVNEYTSEAPPVDERKQKDDAFYTAATVSDDSTLESNYDQILTDMGRFSGSPITKQLRDNWKADKQIQAGEDVSSIVLHPTMPIADKVEAVKRVNWDLQQEPDPKKIFEDRVNSNRATPRKNYGEVRATPRGNLSGKLADFLLGVKTWADKYQVADYVPLIGGTGLGELWLQHAPELVDDVSYNGLSSLIVGGNSATGGIGTYSVDRRVADAVFVGLDVQALASLPRAAARTAINKAYKKAVVEGRIEPTLGGVEDTPASQAIWFNKDSPAATYTKVDKEQAANFLAKAVNSPKIADAAGTSPASIIQHNLLPKLDPEIKGVLPDIYDSLVATDRQFLHYFNLDRVDPYLFDTTAIKKDVDLHYNIIKEQSELTPMMSSSYLEDTGRAFRGNIIYGKTGNLGFTDDLEALDALDMLNNKVSEKYRIPVKKIKSEVFTDPDSGEKFLKWEFSRKYDPVQDTYFGLGSTSAAFGPADVSGFANTTIGKLFFNPSSRLDKWITEGFSRAEIRASNLKKVWGDVMRKEVLSTGPRQELAQAIYKGEELQKHLSVPELRSMFPMMEGETFKSLVNGYSNFRRLDEHMFIVTNSVYRGKKVTAGFKGLYDTDGKYLDNLGKLVEKDPDSLVLVEGEMSKTPGKKILLGSDETFPTEVWDFSLKDGVDEGGKAVRKQTGAKPTSEVDVEATDIYKLDQPIKSEGKTYEFGVGVQSGKVPERLLPRIEGHYPHINDEPYFIKAIPRKLVINGREIPRNAKTEHLFLQEASTVGVARSRKAGEKYAKAFQDKNPDFEYRAVFERTEIDDNLRTSLQTVKYAQDLSKSRREERLLLPDGTLGRLEDPAVALDKRLNQTARIYSWKDIDFEFRNRYMESYGVYSKGEFPTTVEDIKIDPSIATKDEVKNFNNAKNIFEQYAKQQHSKDTFLDPLWRSATLKTAQMMEGVADKGLMKDFANTAAESFRGMSHKREPFLSSALKVATVKYIHWNPIRQWLVQPAQLYELQATALMGGNTKFTRDMISMSPQLFTDSLTRTGKWAPEDIKSYFKTHGHVTTGYSNKEFNEILDAFYDSGISKSIDLQAVVDGVFRSTSDELDVGAIKHSINRGKSIVSGVGSVPRQVGFNSAELLNNIGLWLYARSDFIKRNPTLKWNDPHNLEIIAAKSQQVGNNMLTRSDLFPYQEGAARALMQFMAYTNKAVMQPFVSKGLTTSEKVRLGAARTILYGTSGFLGGQLLLDGVKKAYYGDEPVDPSEVEKNTLVDQTLALADRGLTDLVLNKTLQMSFDEEGGPKTDLLFTKSLSSNPKVGIPMGDIVWDALELLNGEGRIADKVPLLSATSSVFDTVNIMSDALYARKWENLEGKENITKYILKTSEFASGYSNFEKSLAMIQYEAIVDKAGNPLDISATVAEAVFKMGGIQSNKNQIYFDVLKKDASLKKEMKQSATKIIASLDALADIYDPLKKGEASPEEQLQLSANQVDRANHLISIYAAAGLEDELRTIVRTEMDKGNKKGMLPLIQRIQNRQSIKYDVARRQMVEKLGELRGTGDEKLEKLLSGLFTEVENADKGNE